MGKCAFEGHENDCPTRKMDPFLCRECLDAHSCRDDMDAWGYCTTCGAIVRGTIADYTEHGYDPPEDPWEDL